MILTFVIVEHNVVTVAVKLKIICVNVNKERGYVVVYRSKMRHVYCKHEDDIRCDGTVGKTLTGYKKGRPLPVLPRMGRPPSRAPQNQTSTSTWNPTSYT